jgi:hypothetical protein
MKTTFIFLFLGISIFGQMYQRTGRNLGLTLGVQGSMLQGKNDVTGFGGSVGLIHMIHPGIFIKSGYTYLKSNVPSGSRPGLLPPTEHQTIDASLLIDKRILKLSHGRPVATTYGCHYFSIGIIAAPEYHYDIHYRSSGNTTPHEFSGLVGLSFCHIYKNKGRSSMSRSTQYDIFYRHGFTPFFTSSTSGNSFKRAEIGIQIRRIRHQVASSIR